jgi:hypothetical protein
MAYHRFAWDNTGITGLHELRVVLQRLATPTIDLLDELRELTGNVGSMAIEDGCVASANLTGMVENDDLSIEGSRFFGGVILRVRGDITTTNILNRNVPMALSALYSGKVEYNNVLHVETDIVTWKTSLERLVMHFNGFDFGGNV